MTEEKLSIVEINKQHQEISCKIETRWKELTGRKHYMYQWDIIQNKIRIIFEVPLGNGEAWTYHDMIPIKCFEVPLEEAKYIYESC